MKPKRFIVTESNDEFFVGDNGGPGLHVFAVRDVKVSQQSFVKVGATFNYQWLEPGKQELDFTGEHVKVKRTRWFEFWERIGCE
jgi:hypothetical protein